MRTVKNLGRNFVTYNINMMAIGALFFSLMFVLVGLALNSSSNIEKAYDSATALVYGPADRDMVKTEDGSMLMYPVGTDVSDMESIEAGVTTVIPAEQWAAEDKVSFLNETSGISADLFFGAALVLFVGSMVLYLLVPASKLSGQVFTKEIGHIMCRWSIATLAMLFGAHFSLELFSAAIEDQFLVTLIAELVATQLWFIVTVFALGFVINPAYNLAIMLMNKKNEEEFIQVTSSYKQELSVQETQAA